jgi:hypothetical protein
MGTFPELRAAALALNEACGSLSIHFIDYGAVLRLGKALMRWEPVLGQSLTDGSGEAEQAVRDALHLAAIWLYAAIVAVLDQPEREDLQALAQQRIRDYHLEVLHAAVAYHWLPAPPENRAAG